ncbi:MAG: nucleotidyltransferase/DNA polymerase involved in DNA repair [Maribacter sp.]|jgi:nucleotidyltransferase/DNA polymerase involved in DNA repair
MTDAEKKTILAGAKQYFARVKWDDLKVVEGIGPKIEELCHNIGIKTWKALSEAKYDTLKKMLTDAGSRYQMHDPKTWPLQSGMAYKAEWKELKEWQDSHSHGRA